MICINWFVLRLDLNPCLRVENVHRMVVMGWGVVKAGCQTGKDGHWGVARGFRRPRSPHGRGRRRLPPRPSHRHTHPCKSPLMVVVVVVQHEGAAAPRVLLLLVLVVVVVTALLMERRGVAIVVLVLSTRPPTAPHIHDDRVHLPTADPSPVVEIRVGCCVGMMAFSARGNSIPSQSGGGGGGCFHPLSLPQLFANQSSRIFGPGRRIVLMWPFIGLLLGDDWRGGWRVGHLIVRFDLCQCGRGPHVAVVGVVLDVHAVLPHGLVGHVGIDEGGTTPCRRGWRHHKPPTVSRGMMMHLIGFPWPWSKQHEIFW